MTETNTTTVKTCIGCKELKPVQDFHADKNRPDGKSAYCKPCNKLKMAATYLKHKEKRSEKAKADYKANSAKAKDRARKWAAENKEKRRQINKKYVTQNPGTRKETATAYRLANSGLYAAHYKARQTRKQRAMPDWANTGKISRIYRACAAVTRTTGVMHHVDHFYPLKSDFVCGLHNEFNLRIITAVDNLTKSNNIPD